MLVRSWNLFHGRTSPKSGRRYFERMARLICEDAPTLVALQELGTWTLPRLAAWTGYTVFGDVAARPRLPHRIGELITDLNPDLLRSAVEGQANAILVQDGLHTSDHRTLVLNDRRFRRRVADELELGWQARVAWAGERRIAQGVRVRLGDGRTAVVVNVHLTSYRPDKRLADAELIRAAAFADGLAEPDEPVVLAGDFNVTVVSSPGLRALAEAEWGFSAAGPGLDHVLVRGLRVLRPETHWPDDRRRHGDVLLSDHAPVEIEVE